MQQNRGKLAEQIECVDLLIVFRINDIFEEENEEGSLFHDLFYFSGISPEDLIRCLLTREKDFVHFDV